MIDSFHRLRLKNLKTSSPATKSASASRPIPTLPTRCCVKNSTWLRQVCHYVYQFWETFFLLVTCHFKSIYGFEFDQSTLVLVKQTCFPVFFIFCASHPPWQSYRIIISDMIAVTIWKKKKKKNRRLATLNEGNGNKKNECSDDSC